MAVFEIVVQSICFGRDDLHWKSGHSLLAEIDPERECQCVVVVFGVVVDSAADKVNSY